MKRDQLYPFVSAKFAGGLSLLAAAVSAIYTPPVVAAANKGPALEEIVVTVRRRVEMEENVPIAIKAMTGDFLRTQNIGKIEDLGTKVPSLRISGAGGSLNEPIISLRGQRPAESVFAQDPAVPMYFNEVVISPAQGSNLGLYDLQSLQVLKGPQGTLFGRNSTGGAVLMTPKRPGTELGGYAEVKLGDYKLRGFEGAIDLPVNESLQLRISGRKLDRDGYQKNVADNSLHGDTYGDEHSKNLRISINYSQGSLSNLVVLAQDENDIAAAVPITTAANGSVGLGAYAAVVPGWSAWLDGVQRNIDRHDPWKVETDLKSEEYVKNVFASNTTEFELTDDLTLKNVFGYRKVNFETATDIDGTVFPGWGAWTSGAPGVTSHPRPTLLESEFFSDEFQFLGSAFDGDMDWIAGLYWSNLDATQDYLLQTSPAPTYDSGITTAVNKSYGAYGEATYTFTEEWSVTAGIRQSWDDRELTVDKWRDVDRTVCNVTGPGGATLPDCSRTVSEKFNSPTWRVSANYTPAYGQLMYASVSTGYRAGGFNTRGNSDATLKPFNEETVTTYELGHKADWHSLRTGAAIYWQDYEDIHYTRSFDDGGTIVTRTENAGAARIKGVELDVTAVPLESLLFSLSYSYVDAEFTKRYDLIGGVEVDSSGDDFVYIPKQSATGTVTYTLPVDEALGDLSLTASIYWQDDMKTHPLINEFPIMPAAFGGTWSDADVKAMTDFSEVDSYSVWNLRFDWRGIMGSGFDVAAYVNNVEDKQYVLGGLNVVDSGGYGAYTYGAPRTVGASLRYSF